MMIIVWFPKNHLLLDSIRTWASTNSLKLNLKKSVEIGFETVPDVSTCSYQTR